MSFKRNITLLMVGVGLLTACGGAQLRARKEQREKAVQSAHLYCDFINGESFPDVDVALNLEMAKHCDSNKQMTITNYRSPSDAIGIVYCCSYKEEAKDLDMDSKADSKSKSKTEKK